MDATRKVAIGAADQVERGAQTVEEKAHAFKEDTSRKLDEAHEKSRSTAERLRDERERARIAAREPWVPEAQEHAARIADQGGRPVDAAAEHSREHFMTVKDKQQAALAPELGEAADEARQQARSAAGEAKAALEKKADELGARASEAFDTTHKPWRSDQADREPGSKRPGASIPEKAGAATGRVQRSVEETQAIVGDKAHKLGDRTREGLEEAKQAASDSAQAAKERTQEGAQGVAHAAQSLGERIKHAIFGEEAHDPARQAGDAAGDAGNAAKQHWDEAKGSAQESKEAAGHAAREAGGAAKERWEETKQSVADMAAETGDAVKGTAREVGDRVQGGVDSAKSAAKGAGDTVQAATQDPSWSHDSFKRPVAGGHAQAMQAGKPSGRASGNVSQAGDPHSDMATWIRENVGDKEAQERATEAARANEATVLGAVGDVLGRLQATFTAGKEEGRQDKK